MSDQVSNWHGCYREGWGQNRLRPASFAHPAKNSYGLSVRIYEHALAEGWVKPGDYLVDCFAGVGGFALEAMRHGLNFVGVELEQRFVDMGQGCDCTGISKADWVRFQGRWDKARYKNGRYWCPECVMKAGAVTNERKFKPLPLPGTTGMKRAILTRTRQATLFAAAPSASYVRNSGKIPCTEAHHYRGNIETWEAQGMPGTAVIVQGDSRRLGEVLGRAQICLSSPPYAGSLHGQDDKRDRKTREAIAGKKLGGFSPPRHYGNSAGQLSNLPDTGFEAALTISSPVYHSNTASDDPDKRGGLYRDPKRRNDKTLTATYSKDEAQLAQMPEGRLAEVIKYGIGQYGERWQDALAWVERQKQQAALPEGSHAEACERPTCAISSPPFCGSELSTDEQFRAKMDNPGRNWSTGAYSSQANIAQMPPGDHAAALDPSARPACADTQTRAQAGAGAVTGRAQACISSPPWENMAVAAGDQARDKGFSRYDPSTRSAPNRNGLYSVQYGDAEGQLGQQQGSTFWAASRQILEEVYQVLAPGGHAIFVCKRFVRSKKIVEFPLQWAHLCEAVGFKWIHHHKAWLVEDRGAQHTLEGGLEKRTVKRCSFFRRLAESKGSPAIDWEDVLCFVK